MDEYRRPFEYEEEKGVVGFILIFFIMLIVFEPIISINMTLMGDSILMGRYVWHTIFYVAAVGYFGLLLLTCIALFKIRRIAVAVVNAFLAYRLVFLTLMNIIVFISYFDYRKNVTVGPMVYNSVTELVLGLLVGPLFYIVSFSVLWYIYFKKSKRVRTNYLDR